MSINKQKQAITIMDIARHAGVSPSTVSRILNSTTPVAPKKQAAVMEAIERLGYRPNIVAQGLVRGRSSTIGVLTQNFDSPFYGEIMVGIEQGLQSTPYYPVFASGKWIASEELKALDLLIGRQVDAMIILGGQISDAQLRQVAEEKPLVVVGRSVSGLEGHCLVVQNFEAGYKATSYLIEMGHINIAHISGLVSHADAVERYNGYRQALIDAGLKFDPRLVIEGNYREQSGVLGVETLLAGKRGLPFSAIFTGNDQMAAGARLALYRRGIRVPDDISLIGFDDQPGSAYVTPPLTTMRQPSCDMGIAAAQLVLAILDGKESRPPVFSTQLIVRESVAGLYRNGH